MFPTHCLLCQSPLECEHHQFIDTLPFERHYCLSCGKFRFWSNDNQGMYEYVVVANDYHINSNMNTPITIIHPHKQPNSSMRSHRGMYIPYEHDITYFEQKLRTLLLLA